MVPFWVVAWFVWLLGLLLLSTVPFQMLQTQKKITFEKPTAYLKGSVGGFSKVILLFIKPFQRWV